MALLVVGRGHVAHSQAVRVRWAEDLLALREDRDLFAPSPSKRKAKDGHAAETSRSGVPTQYPTAALEEYHS